MPHHLQSLHPDEPECKYNTFECDPANEITVDPETVNKIIIKAKKSVSAGPAGYKPVYFKQLIKFPSQSLLIPLLMPLLVPLY